MRRHFKTAIATGIIDGLLPGVPMKSCQLEEVDCHLEAVVDRIELRLPARTDFLVYSSSPYRIAAMASPFLKVLYF